MLNWFIMEVDNEGWIRKSIRKEGTEKQKKGGGEGRKEMKDRLIEERLKRAEKR